MRGLLLGAVPRQRATTVAIDCSSIPFAQSRSPPHTAWLLGMQLSGSSSKRSRVTVGTPAPITSASRVPSDGRNDSSRLAESDTAARTIFWSSSWPSRMANTVEHCEISVGSSWCGRWVTRPRKTPCLRPSLAMRDSPSRAVRKPTVAIGIGVIVRFLANDEQRT